MTDERLCSACLAADPPRETPATHDDYERRVEDGRALLWCCDHAWWQEPPLKDGHQCGVDDDSTSDRRPAALAVIGVGLLPWALLWLWLVVR